MKRNDRLAADIEGLQDLDLMRLRERWTEVFGSAPVPRISRDVLIRAVAWRLQENAEGGINKSLRRRLTQMARTLGASGAAQLREVAVFKPGTKLIREWKGRVLEVVLCEDGYVWNGKRYRSLSEIARTITGTRWSGPRFFGLEAGKAATDD